MTLPTGGVALTLIGRQGARLLFYSVSVSILSHICSGVNTARTDLKCAFKYDM